MSIIKHTISLIVLIALSVTAYTQPWMKNIEKDPDNAGFYEVQDAFNQYWAKREYEKGKGFKQFKRWEYFMEPRVDKDGYINPRAVYDAWKKCNTHHLHKKMKWQTGHTSGRLKHQQTSTALQQKEVADD